MSIKQNFPTIRPTLNLDFAGSQAVDSRIQFTRASAATHTDAQGILRTVRDNKSRVDFDPSTGECKGLLIEEQRTNLIVYSNDPDYSSWTLSGASIAKNVAIAPDGTMSADKIVENTATVTHGHYQMLSVSNSTLYTWSAYFKAAERTSVMVYAQSSRTPTAIYNLSTGTVTSIDTAGDTTATATITPAGNGWYRCTITATTVGTTAYHNIAMVVSGNQTYAGNGSSGLFVWGAQFEAGGFATSYVPTTPTFVSRASSATYYDSTGILRTAPAGGARYGFGYDSATQKWVSQGLILESAATNLYSDSNGLLTSLSGATASTSTVLGLDATTYAQRVQVSSNYVYKYFPSILGGGATHTWSFFVKPVNNFFRFANGGTPGSFNYYFDFTPAVPTASFSGSGFTNLGYTTTAVGNGWWRVSCTVNGTGTAGYMEAQWSYGGSGSADFYIWGVQCETGTVATSYIATSGSTVTRAADVSTSAATTRAAEFTKFNMSNIGYGQPTNLGSTVNFVTKAPVTANVGVFGFTGQSQTNWGVYSFGDGSWKTYESLVGYGIKYFGYSTPDVDTKIAQSWGTNAAYGINGTSDVMARAVGKLDTLTIGYVPYDFHLNGWIKHLKIYPQALSTTAAKALTV